MIGLHREHSRNREPGLPGRLVPCGDVRQVRQVRLSDGIPPYNRPVDLDHIAVGAHTAIVVHRPRYRGQVRSLVIAAAVVLLGTAPAHAGSASSGPVTVSVQDATWTSYDCQTTTATLSVSVEEYVPWVATIQASPDGKSQLNAAAFADIGSNTMTQPLLICPLDSNGAWTARVQARFLTQTVSFTVPFTVSHLTTTTTINSARWRNKVLRVTGSAIAANGMAGRASISVERLHNGSWRNLGHTNANRNGVFRFLAPRKAEQVRVTYLGDSVTLQSQSQLAVTVIKPKKR